MKKQKYILAVKCEPGKKPKWVTLKNDLQSLQEAVSVGAPYVGHIEIVRAFDDVALLINDEGKILDLEPSLVYRGDIVCGVCYIVGVKGENLASLTDDAAKRIEQYIGFKIT